MSGRWCAVLVGLLLALGCGTAWAQDRGPLLIPSGSVSAAVATTDQDVLVAGEVRGDLTSWSGAITVRGLVRGDVVSYSGRVVVEPGGVVEGSVMAPGGGLTVAAGARVGGQRFGAASGSPALSGVVGMFVAGSHSAAPDARLLRITFGIALGGLLLALALLWPLVWPQRTALAALALWRLPGRATLLGVLTTMLLALVLPLLLAVLIGSLVGSPLALLLLALLQVPYIYGLAVVVRRLGGQGPRGVRTLGVGALLALLIGGSAMVSPPLGALLGYLIASPGLGAAILSRGGLAAPAG